MPVQEVVQPDIRVVFSEVSERLSTSFTLLLDAGLPAAQR
jgi:hypothetical protein